jgi:hypothetical protein
MSHVICSAALIALIFVSQFFYVQVINNLEAEMTKRELQEVADYVSDTLANLYFLVNSTQSDVEMKKSLNLPSEIRDSIYTVKIAFNVSGYARNVTAHLKGQPWVSADSWLLPGLKVDQLESEVVESGEKTVVAGCARVSTDVYVWIKEL